MKQFIVCLIALAALTISCSKPALDLNPDSYLSKEEQTNFKIDLSRYIHKLPPRTTMEMRWDSSAYSYYKNNANIIELVKLYKAENDSTYYFYITRIAPSVRQGERKAIAGKCNYSNKRISNIEEIFISTIESVEVLEEHAEELLTEVIKTNKAPIPNKLIEWPNDYFYYNKGTNQWDRVSSRK
ncbi:hypothetical protein [Cytophaga aurantiaca]|uniref:hypothetical protein n=1 Tax=Cytophaga aurantiaca TaxID=29530 RepID=UPI00037218B1|nr:hypothetical protein [Cytophaga aurantiaca]